MKKLALVAALGLIGLVSGVANAATATSTFNVNLTLTPKCYVNMTAAPASAATTDVTLTYDSFQSTHSEGSTGFQVNCTNGLGYSVGIDTVAANQIAAVQYHLNLTAGTTPTYASSTTASLPGLTGTGTTAQDYTIAVRAPSGQSGTCATAAPGTCSGTNLHTITVSY